MRKIIYWVHASIDGHIAGPGGEFDWPALGPELFGYSEAMNEQVDTLLYGRVVWDMMAAYWPTADADPGTTDDHGRAFAPFWRRTPKVVVSRTLEEPGDNPLRDAHARLDAAVRTTYEMPDDVDPLAFLLDLNLACAAKEKVGEKITAPGLPLQTKEHAKFITEDCIQPPDDR